MVDEIIPPIIGTAMRRITSEPVPALHMISNRHNGDHSHHFRPHAIDRAQHDRLPGGRRALPPLRRMLPSTT